MEQQESATRTREEEEPVHFGGSSPSSKRVWLRTVMRPTHRGWVALATPAITLAMGVVVASPVVVASAGALLAVVLALAVRFVLQLRALHAAVTVERTVTPTPAYEHQPVQIRTLLSITDETEPDLLTTGRQPLPLAANHRGGDPSTAVTGKTPVATTVTLEFDVAGQYTVAPVELDCQDSHGWFATTLKAGAGTSVEIVPDVPDDVTVGQGTERFVLGDPGGQDDSHGSGGVDPGELRPYQPGDSHAHIDWKTTARLGEVFVRKFETATDVETLVLLDRRATGTTDAVGRTQLDYLRQVALWLVEQAREQDRLIGVAIVDEDGVIDQLLPRSGPEHYRALIRRLYDLDAPDAVTGNRTVGVRDSRSPADTELATDEESAFTAILSSYFRTTEASVDHADRDPLFAAAKANIIRMTGTPRVIILTTDAGRENLVKTAQLAARRGSQTTLFLAPEALFGRKALLDSSQAYRDYVDFESFRRQLHDVGNVTAYDIGPARQVNAVLREADGADR